MTKNGQIRVLLGDFFLTPNLVLFGTQIDYFENFPLVKGGKNVEKRLIWKRGKKTLYRPVLGVFRCFWSFFDFFMNFGPCHNFLGGGPGKVAKSVNLMIGGVWAMRNSSPTFQELRGAAPCFCVFSFLGFFGIF